MTTKIANVANLALHAFQQHSLRVTIASAAASASGAGAGTAGAAGSPTVPNPAAPVSPDQSIAHFPSDDSFPLLSHDSPTHSYLTPSTNGESDPLQRLLLSVRNLTPKDVGFDVRWISDSHVYAAPVAYIHITENEVFSMGIFVLRPGSRIPLHDHPGMYGVLRVMYGSLRCRSFTPLHNIRPNHPAYPRSSLSAAFPGSGWQFRDLIVARPYQDVVLNVDSFTQLLQPVEGNLHEVTPVDGPAVFLDILAPPYDHDLGTRECRFYKEVILPQQQPVLTEPRNQLTSADHGTEHDHSQSLHQHHHHHCHDPHHHRHHHHHHHHHHHNIDSNGTASINGPGGGSQLIYLVETNQPKDYWCESAEYVGPSVV